MTTNASNPVSRLVAAGGQKLFLLSLCFAAVLASVGFSLTIFGALSGLLSTTFDQLMVSGIGVALMLLGTGLGYAALN
ncbi:MAG: hypothetical protein ABEH90_02265 [Halolamina sp.]